MDFLYCQPIYARISLNVLRNQTSPWKVELPTELIRYEIKPVLTEKCEIEFRGKWKYVAKFHA